MTTTFVKFTDPKGNVLTGGDGSVWTPVNDPTFDKKLEASIKATTLPAGKLSVPLDNSGVAAKVQNALLSNGNLAAEFAVYDKGRLTTNYMLRLGGPSSDSVDVTSPSQTFGLDYTTYYRFGYGPGSPSPIATSTYDFRTHKPIPDAQLPLPQNRLTPTAPLNAATLLPNADAHIDANGNTNTVDYYLKFIDHQGNVIPAETQIDLPAQRSIEGLQGVNALSYSLNQTQTVNSQGATVMTPSASLSFSAPSSSVATKLFNAMETPTPLKQVEVVGIDRATGQVVSDTAFGKVRIVSQAATFGDANSRTYQLKASGGYQTTYYGTPPSSSSIGPATTTKYNFTTGTADVGSLKTIVPTPPVSSSGVAGVSGIGGGKFDMSSSDPSDGSGITYKITLPYKSATGPLSTVQSAVASAKFTITAPIQTAGDTILSGSFSPLTVTFQGQPSSSVQTALQNLSADGTITLSAFKDGGSGTAFDYDDLKFKGVSLVSTTPVVTSNGGGPSSYTYKFTFGSLQEIYNWQPSGGQAGSSYLSGEWNQVRNVSNPPPENISTPRPPVASADTYNLVAGQTLTVSADRGVLANDQVFETDPRSVAVATDASGTPLAPQHGMVTLAVDGSFAYTPTSGYIGTDSFSYTLTDTSFSSSPDFSASSTVTVSLTVLDPNGPPTGTAATLAMPENDAHVFSAAEFGFFDPGDHAFKAVEITTLPGAGTLTANGTAVTAGQFVGAADIAAGRLVFTPVANATGAPYATFSFQVQDDGGIANGRVDTDPTPRTLTIGVTPPPPVVTGVVYDALAGTLTLTGTDFTLQAGDFHPGALQVVDADGTAAYALTTSNGAITGLSSTTLTLTLNDDDRAAVKSLLLNTQGTLYNLVAGSGWDAGAGPSDPPIGVTNGPALSGVFYDADSATLTLTGTTFSAAAGDFDPTKLTLTGEGGRTYTLTAGSTAATPSRDETGGSSVILTLNAADKAAVAALLDQNGSTALGGAVYGLTAAAGWDAGALALTTPVGVTASGVLVTGRAIDGYLAGAIVFADANGDGLLSTGEISTTTDASGNFTLPNGATLVLLGGTDISTGLPNSATLTAPVGSTVVTPLTTLIQAIVASGNRTAAQAQGQVAAAFGLGSADLTTLDPVAGALAGNAAATKAYAAGAQVSNTLALLTAGGSTTAVSTLAGAIAGANGGAVDLTSSATLTSLAIAANVSSPATVAAVAAASNGAVASAAAANTSPADLVRAIAAVQKVAEGTVAPSLVAAGSNAAALAGVQSAYTGTSLSNAVAGALASLTPQVYGGSGGASVPVTTPAGTVQAGTTPAGTVPTLVTPAVTGAGDTVAGPSTLPVGDPLPRIGTSPPDSLAGTTQFVTGITDRPYTSIENVYDANERLAGQTFYGPQGNVFKATSTEYAENGSFATMTSGGAYFNRRPFFAYVDRFASDGTQVSEDVFYKDGHQSVQGLVQGATLNSITKDTFLTQPGGGNTFVFTPGFGHDTITSFIVGGPHHDTLSLPDSAAGRLGAILAHATADADGSAVLHLNRTDSITIQGVTVADLRQHRADFAFQA